MIYFAQLATGAIKIGTTGDIKGRLAWLAAHYGQRLKLLSTIPGGRAKEREIHERFAHLRVGRTERFEPGDDLLDFIPGSFVPVPEKGQRQQSGTLVRVSEGFAEALRDATRFEKTSVAEFADAHLLPVVRKRYREAVLKEARRVEGEGGGK